MITHPLDIIPRDLRFEIGAHADAGWLDGSHVRSAFVDSFATMLPEGERFFIRSLKGSAHLVDDPVIRQDIRGYAEQEAFHTREHEAYNAALRGLGYDVDGLEALVRRYFAVVREPVHRLIITCGIEHMTYMFARLVLERPEILAGASPAYRRLWHWHALEEMEHAAVALRVLRAASPRLPRWKRWTYRCLAMAVIHLCVLGLASFWAARNLRRSQGPRGPRAWLGIAASLFWRPGWALRTLPWLFAYFRPGYQGHPAVDAALIARGRRLLSEAAAATAAVPG